MTDKQFLKSVQKATAKVIEAMDAISVAEAEYERRYGVHPSDIDNDDWIDAVQYGRASYRSIAEIDEHHKLHSK